MNLTKLIIFSLIIAGGIGAGIWHYATRDNVRIIPPPEVLEKQIDRTIASIPAPTTPEKPKAIADTKQSVQKSMSEKQEDTAVSLVEMPESLGLDEYFGLLNEENSETYVVVSGDNLTKIGRRYSVTPGTLMAANRLKNDVIRPGMKLKVMKDRWSIMVHKSTNTLQLKAGDQIVKNYSVATGADESVTPVGNFKIINKLVNPTWYYDGKVEPPDSPDNPLGSRWLGFDLEGYGLHGTIEPESIGKNVSLGCIRMQNHEVEEIFDLIPIGTVVNVIH